MGDLPTAHSGGSGADTPLARPSSCSFPSYHLQAPAGHGQLQMLMRHLV